MLPGNTNLKRLCQDEYSFFDQLLLKKIIVVYTINSTLLFSGNLHLIQLQRLANSEWFSSDLKRQALSLCACSTTSKFNVHSYLTQHVYFFLFLKLIVKIPN